jgi:hypothetical protein
MSAPDGHDPSRGLTPDKLQTGSKSKKMHKHKEMPLLVLPA